jgi:hypothetical protein
MCAASSRLSLNTYVAVKNGLTLRLIARKGGLARE